MKSFVKASSNTSILVIGSGLMGSGIAQVSAMAGYNVVLSDLNKQYLDKAYSSIQSSLSKTALKKFPDQQSQQQSFIIQTMSRLSLSTDAIKSCKSSDLIIEAIVENLSVKQQLFQQLDQSAPKHSIFTSNTSSLPIDSISKVTSASRQSQFGGLHFFNPVPQMKLVEVIRTGNTMDETFTALLDYAKSIGKVPVSCKDTPGFIVNRLLVPYMMEALRMAERGDATPEDIDIAMKLGAGYPMGPFELADFVGLDTLKFITDGWRKGNSVDGLGETIETLEKLVQEGKYGRKSGQGFYSYNNKKK